ncbi:malonyl-CoA:anthocyanidin 5-O-glucoside-6''-O-malonyltransferase-like [Neltuma alba]|uniref:malonyl-CoA:anthocyanidin 5-O-glucoside-6''-O-malonyltransferase-like n=1 Tax=Neltuma alba TaxID=207710 RepID=UPI0010A4EA23|nr:malonyl-CoA:anthocyanidin 5-O-glucoside-6''-O-malonyltransferase-like [Prosopis alba]
MASLSPNRSLKPRDLCRISPPPSSPKSSFSLTFFDFLWLRYHPVERLFFFSVPHLNPSSFFLNKSRRNASQSCAFVPNLDSSDSFSSVLSTQITLFPNSGFCIGMSLHHGCLDGKSSSFFIKAWAHLCRTEAGNESSGLLPQKLQPFLDREVIIDPHGIEVAYINGLFGLDPTLKKPGLKILSDMFPPKVEDSSRATFKLKHGDLNKIKERVLQNKTRKLLFYFPADYRDRLQHPIPETYFGNCVMPQIIEIQPEDLKDEDGVVMVAKKIHRKIKKIEREKGALDGAETLFSWYSSLLNDEEKQVMGIVVAGSARFCLYQVDFGWGRPEKVEKISVYRTITMAMAESKDGDGGVEVGLALKT